MSRFVESNMNKASYRTWYEFEKDFQKEVMLSIFNGEWLQIKPVKPRYLDDSFARLTLLKLAKKAW